VNPYLSVVNQHVCFSALLLEQLAECEGKSTNRLQVLALAQSVLLQLEISYRFYLREVAATYKCREPEQIQDVDTLISALQSMGKHPAEASELANLEQQRGSWLSGLLAACHQVMRVQSEQVSQHSPIAVVQVSSDQDDQELTAERLSGWRKDFLEVVERHRQHMLEC